MTIEMPQELAAIENNLFSFGLAQNETDADHDDRIES